MTVLFEMDVRVGGDPRRFVEFAALCDELAKLNHAACPDMDWAAVEQLCLTLFRLNGADLQSVAALTLARGHRYGLEGIAQGLALLEGVSRAGVGLWPAQPSARQEVLGWLFSQLQLCLRAQPVNVRLLPALGQLDDQLLRLQWQLQEQGLSDSGALQRLRQQIEQLRQRVRSSDVQWPTVQRREPMPPMLMPVMLLPFNKQPEANPAKKPRKALWLGVAVVVLVVGGIGWWGASSESGQRLASVLRKPQPLPQAVRLESLALFEAGSAELKPDGNKVLINALNDITARSGWLIVIDGHSDNRGSAEHKLLLSHARAWAVRGWLQRMGDIPDSCFVVQGLADKQPLVSNDSAAGRATNRRVDVSLVPQAGAGCGSLK
ncbi:OmpA family protein [Pseudomonas sp. S2_C03]